MGCLRVVWIIVYCGLRNAGLASAGRFQRVVSSVLLRPSREGERDVACSVVTMHAYIQQEGHLLIAGNMAHVMAGLLCSAHLLRRASNDMKLAAVNDSFIPSACMTRHCQIKRTRVQMPQVTVDGEHAQSSTKESLCCVGVCFDTSAPCNIFVSKTPGVRYSQVREAWR
eukprot:3478982-Amphidinium_carterae.1